MEGKKIEKINIYTERALLLYTIDVELFDSEIDGYLRNNFPYLIGQGQELDVKLPILRIQYRGTPVDFINEMNKKELEEKDRVKKELEQKLKEKDEELAQKLKEKDEELKDRVKKELEQKLEEEDRVKKELEQKLEEKDEEYKELERKDQKTKKELNKVKKANTKVKKHYEEEKKVRIELQKKVGKVEEQKVNVFFLFFYFSQKPERRRII